MNANNFDFDAYVQELLDNTTPDELFDFFEEQGMFDSLKDKTALSLDWTNEPVFTSYLREVGKIFGQCGANTIDIPVLQTDAQLIAA